MSISRLILPTVLCGALLTPACRRTPSGVLPANTGAESPAERRPERVTLQLVRNATITVGYGGTKFLVDPMLAAKGAYPGFKGTPRSELGFPLVDLPLPVDQILDVDAVVLTHLHDDHWDTAARELVPRDMPIFVQDDDDAVKVRGDGFVDVRVLAEEGSQFDGVRLFRVGGQHGTDAMYSVAPLRVALGDTMGIVFQRENHHTVYVAGDTVWNKDVESAIARYRPGVAVLNAGYAQVTGFEGAIIMGTDDLLRAHSAVPNATIVAVHMDAVNHAMLSRTDLRAFIARQRLPRERTLVPEDGEAYAF